MAALIRLFCCTLLHAQPLQRAPVHSCALDSAQTCCNRSVCGETSPAELPLPVMASPPLWLLGPPATTVPAACRVAAPLALSAASSEAARSADCSERAPVRAAAATGSNFCTSSDSSSGKAELATGTGGDSCAPGVVMECGVEAGAVAGVDARDEGRSVSSAETPPEVLVVVAVAVDGEASGRRCRREGEE